MRSPFNYTQCVLVPLVCVCSCLSMCVWVIIIFDDTDGRRPIVCAFYLCHTLFDYAEGTVCSVSVCVCVCVLGLSITVPYISPPRLSLPVVHTHT